MCVQQRPAQQSQSAERFLVISSGPLKPRRAVGGWNEVHANFQICKPSQSIASRDSVVVTERDTGYSSLHGDRPTGFAGSPPVSFNKGATDIFRLEDGKWNIIHHYADASKVRKTPPDRSRFRRSKRHPTQIGYATRLDHLIWEILR
jgi:hypothetical protein